MIPRKPGFLWTRNEEEVVGRLSSELLADIDDKDGVGGAMFKLTDSGRETIDCLCASLGYEVGGFGIGGDREGRDDRESLLRVSGAG